MSIITNVVWWFRRWRYRWINFMDGADSLSRRVTVEQVLLDCANGKRPTPDRDECRILAYKLGVPARIGGRRRS